MRVGIAAWAAGNPGGLGRLARTYVLALAQARPDWELHVFLRRPGDALSLADEADGAADGLLDKLRLHVSVAPWLNRAVQEELLLPAAFRPLGLDAFVGLDFTLPRARLAPLEAVVVPDLLPFTHPRTVGLRARWLYRRGLRGAVRRGAGLICISPHTRAELLRLFPTAATQAKVVLPALSPRLTELAAQAAVHDHVPQVRGSAGTFTAASPYLLYVGDFGPRKNVPLLLEAQRRLVGAGHYGGGLVLVGGDGRYSRKAVPQLAYEAVGSAEGQAQSSAPLVHDLGRVSDAELSQLYASADLLVNLSVAEGFGYPVLEALAHGTPALVTRGSAMQDIAPGGIAACSADSDSAVEGLRRALAALPLLRQEANALPPDWFKIDRLGEELALTLEAAAASL